MQESHLIHQDPSITWNTVVVTSPEMHVSVLRFIYAPQFVFCHESLVLKSTLSLQLACSHVLQIFIFCTPNYCLVVSMISSPSVNQAYYSKEVKHRLLADLLYWGTTFMNNICPTAVGFLILCTHYPKVIGLSFPFLWWLAVCNWRWCIWKQSSTTYIQLYSGCTENRTATLTGHTPWRRKGISYTTFL